MINKDKVEFYKVMAKYFSSYEYDINLCSDPECNCCGSRKGITINKYTIDGCETIFDSENDCFDFISIPVGFDSREEFNSFLNDYVFGEDEKDYIKFYNDYSEQFNDMLSKSFEGEPILVLTSEMSKEERNKKFNDMINSRTENEEPIKEKKMINNKHKKLIEEYYSNYSVYEKSDYRQKIIIDSEFVTNVVKTYFTAKQYELIEQLSIYEYAVSWEDVKRDMVLLNNSDFIFWLETLEFIELALSRMPEELKTKKFNRDIDLIIKKVKKYHNDWLLND